MYAQVPGWVDNRHNRKPMFQKVARRQDELNTTNPNMNNALNKTGYSNNNKGRETPSVKSINKYNADIKDQQELDRMFTMKNNRSNDYRVGKEMDINYNRTNNRSYGMTQLMGNNEQLFYQMGHGKNFRNRIRMCP